MSWQDWQRALLAFNRDPRRIAWLVALLKQATESVGSASGVEETNRDASRHSMKSQPRPRQRRLDKLRNAVSEEAEGVDASRRRIWLSSGSSSSASH